MSKVAFHLPGNRGVLSGPEGAVIGNEMRRQQAIEQAKETQLWFSNVPGNFSGLTDVAPVDGTCYFYPMEPLIGKIRLNKARIGITVAGAGCSAVCALYRLQSPGAMQLTEVAKTRVSFDSSLVSVREVLLPEEVEIQPSGRYFVGFRATSPAPTSYLGIDSSVTGSTLARLTIAGSLESAVNLVALTKDYYAPVVAITYMTNFGAQVF